MIESIEIKERARQTGKTTELLMKINESIVEGRNIIVTGFSFSHINKLSRYCRKYFSSSFYSDRIAFIEPHRIKEFLRGKMGFTYDVFIDEPFMIADRE